MYEVHTLEGGVQRPRKEQAGEVRVFKEYDCARQYVRWLNSFYFKVINKGKMKRGQAPIHAVVVNRAQTQGVTA